MATLKRWNGTAWVPVGGDTFLTKSDAQNAYAPIGSVGNSPKITPDLNRTGFFTNPSGSSVTESPTRPGVFVIGA